MGADKAPDAEIEGVVAALGEADLDVILVGDETLLRARLEARGAGDHIGARIEIRHAPEVIGMHDAPAIAVKQKKHSSMRVCFDLVKAAQADALVSAGNSGAMMACGLFVLGRLPGVDRPAIVTTFPTKRGQCALLDMGANVDPKPAVLAQFAVLGSVYAQKRHRKPRPRVGLLSNGAEEHKGTALTRQSHHLLERATRSLADGSPRADFDYVGYVEGRDIFEGNVDVVVTDGFTGNVLLKSCEGAVEAVFGMVRQEVLGSGPLVKLGALLMRPALRRLWRRTDPAETGGAPLLGVSGVALICHGGSDARAIKNAVLVARDFASASLGDETARAVKKHEYLWHEGTDAGDRAGATVS